MKLQSDEIEQLKQHNRQLESQLFNNQHGSSSIIERKIENIRREMRSSMEALQAQIQCYSKPNEFDESMKYQNDMTRTLAIQ